MFYKIVIECGHVGAGKGYDVVRYFEGNNMPEVMNSLRKMPRLKVKRTSKAIKLIKTITEREYLRGLNVESANPYLAHVH